MKRDSKIVVKQFTIILLVAFMIILVIVVSGIMMGMSSKILQLKSIIQIGLAFLFLIIGIFALYKLGQNIFPHNKFPRDWNTTFDAVSDVLWLLDKDFKIIRTNQAAEKLLGMRAKDLIGKHCWEIVHQTSIQDVECPVFEVNRTGKSASSEIQAGEKWFYIIINPIYSHNKELMGYVHTIRDITVKKNIEVAIVKIQKQNALLADLLQNSSQPFAIIYRGGRISMCNAAFRNLLGYTEEEFTEIANINSITPLEWAEYENDNINKLLQTGEPVRFEKEYIRKDGSRIPVEIFLHMSKDLSGELQFFYSFATEITERKRAERTLKESEERFRKVADSAYEWIWEIDETGLYTYCSAAVEMILGYKSDELVGKKHYYDLFLSENREDLKAEVTKIFSKKNAFHGLINKNLHKNGTIVTLKTSGSPVVSTTGNLIGYIGTAQDITLQQQSEEDLRRLSERLLMATKSAKIGIWELDYATQTTIWDDTIYQLFDIIPGQEVDYNEVWRKRVHPKDLIEYKKLEQEAIVGDGKIDSLFRVILDNGSIRYIKVDAILQRDSTGKPSGLVGTNYDITTIKLAEEAIRGLNEKLEQKVKERTESLEKANKELEAFSHSISHDLRGPLRTIDGWSLALVEDYYDLIDDRGKVFLGRIRNGAQQMGLIMDAILKLFRIVRAELLISKVNLSEISQKIISDLKLQNPDRKVKVIIQPDLIIKGDAVLLNLVMVNLLNNAWKFTSTKPEAIIEFGKKEIDNQTVFFVNDNGVGFEMKYASKLFGAFQRMHSDKEFSGTGIGLATVKSIINCHGGKIWAETKVNQGATFYFTLKEI